VTEPAAAGRLPAAPDGFEALDRRRYGSARFSFLRYGP